MRGVGIAGSGRVARSFLTRLHTAGLAVRAYGAGKGGTAEPFAAGLRILILTPRDIAEAEALLFETEGFAKNAPHLKCIVICATLSPRYVRALRGRIATGIALVDAPYSGSMRAAEEGRLKFFLGGRREDIELLDPILTHLGRQATRMGGFGTAMAAKVMNNFLAASATAMTRIALDWAEAQGIDEARMLKMTEGSLEHGALSSGSDLVEFTSVGAGSDECLTTLIKEVEYALDTALANAHLTPPRAMDELFRNMKSRALH